MNAPSPLFLALAAFICSIIGRAYLVRAAFEISKGWGVTVMCVPFGPYFFRRKYKELAGEGKNWRTMTSVFSIAFIAITGGSARPDDFWALVPERFRPAEYAEKAAPDADHAADSDDEGDDAAPAPAVVPPSYAERIAANQAEFARLGEVYESLKRERGYLRKHDDEGVRAYNAEAAKYQADLVKARAEQVDLNKLLAKK